MLRSLNSRLLLSYIFVILVCLVLVGLGLFLFVRASPLWTSAALLQLDAATREAISTLRQAGPLQTLPPEQLRALLTQIAQEQEVRLLLLDSGGTVRFDSERAWEGKRIEETTRAPNAQGRVRGDFTAPTGGRWAFVGQVLTAQSEGRLVLAFVSPQGRMLMLAWFAENLLPPLMQAGLVAFVLSVLLALFVSRSVAAPLRRVASTAEAIARGEIGTRAPISGPPEVRALARSFNTMADQVEATQRSQRDFVANVSHDLKTPLTSIQGFSQALLDGTASTPEATAHAVHVIHEEAERMRRLVDELLILARFDGGQSEMAHESVELGPLLQGCIEKLTPQAQAVGVVLELDVPDRLAVTGDGDRLAQVFTNLLDNAIGHTPAEGKVMLAAHQVGAATPKGRSKDAVEITVTDTGRGIPAEEFPRIFERFYQVDKSRQRGRGAGLGLAIAKEIIEAHGGTIIAESVTGLGTRFTVQIPCAG
jgi:two-component system OmpR family sensor kinase